MVVIFFFQAEDGIRVLTVTGVQTCALPISGVARGRDGRIVVDEDRVRDDVGRRRDAPVVVPTYAVVDRQLKIGRASCRERVKISDVARSFKKKKNNSPSNNAMHTTVVKACT